MKQEVWEFFPPKAKQNLEILVDHFETWFDSLVFTMKPCCCNRCSMHFYTDLLKCARLSLKKLSSGWKHSLKTVHVQAASSISTNTPPYHQRCRLLK